MTKRALILGIGGQDGSYMADLLLRKGYAVAGLYRHSSYDNLARIAHCRNRVTLFRGDLLDHPSVERALTGFRPDEVYNLADQDRVDWSRDVEVYQRKVTAEGAAAMLDRVRLLVPTARAFQPLSCTMFAKSVEALDEGAGVMPESPYARYKYEAWRAARYWRARGVWVACGIMFNHDSPRRGPGYVLQDVVRAAVGVARGERPTLDVHSLDARVDVGAAPDYMDAAWRMLQADAPDDYCVGTGVAWTVREMAERAVRRAGRDPRGVYFTEREITLSDAPHYRADYSKIKGALGWEPTTGVGELIDTLVDYHRGKE